MILITSANGNQGKWLIPKLLALNLQVRACVQTETSARQLRSAGVDDVIVADLSNVGVATRLMQGINKVYHIGPTAHPFEREIGFALIDAAKAEGVEHFVFSSVLHAITSDLLQHAIKRDVEEHLLSSGLEFSILQPANYMLPLKLQPAFGESVFRLSWSLERHQSMVDLDDVGHVAAKVLANSAHHVGATYELVGEGRYTGYEIAEIIARITHRPTSAEEISADTYLKVWFGDADANTFMHQANVLRSISARYSSHDFVGNPNVLTWLLGRRPTSFEQFVKREYATYQTAQSGRATGEPTASRRDVT